MFGKPSYSEKRKLLANLQDLAEVKQNDQEEFFEQVYEITINFKKPAKLDDAMHVLCYREMWLELVDRYKPTKHTYYIERCKTGQAHLHGYVQIKYPMTLFNQTDKIFLESISRFFFKRLPKKYWNQFLRATYKPHYRQLNTPAVHIEMKNFLNTNWETYISKNAPQ